MNAGWSPLAGGAVTGIIIATVQRKYPDASFLALVGVGLICGAIFNLLIWAVSKKVSR